MESLGHVDNCSDQGIDPSFSVSFYPFNSTFPPSRIPPHLYCTLSTLPTPNLVAPSAPLIAPSIPSHVACSLPQLTLLTLPWVVVHLIDDVVEGVVGDMVEGVIEDLILAHLLLLPFLMFLTLFVIHLPL